jgi:biopolymer transport protein ExbD
MPIYAPGRRDRHNRTSRNSKRSVVVMLSLTAMVDMFTVLVVFLLQNYQTTGEVLEMSDEVSLPKAHAVKELQPAHVVVVKRDTILLDKDVVASFAQVKEQPDMHIEGLYQKLKERFIEADQRRAAIGQRLRDAVAENKAGRAGDSPEDDRRITIQADRSVDILTIKKIMTTLAEVGASEINFAVIKEEPGH